MRLPRFKRLALVNRRLMAATGCSKTLWRDVSRTSGGLVRRAAMYCDATCVPPLRCGLDVTRM